MPKLRPRNRQQPSILPQVKSPSVLAEGEASVSEAAPVIDELPAPAEISSDLEPSTAKISEHTSEIVEAFKAVEPVYSGHIKLLHWAHNSTSGMTMKTELLDVDHTKSHPFKSLRAAKMTKTEGQRLKLVMTQSDLSGSPGTPVFHGESVLVWWAEDCAEGMKVTFKLDEGVDGANFKHPCDGFETGRKNGEVLLLVVWAIDDQDFPEKPKSKQSRRSFNELPATVQTQILCRDSRFFQFLLENERVYVDDEIIRSDLAAIKNDDQDQYCEIVLKTWCNIASRAELNIKDEDDLHAKEALSRWQVMHKNYNEWKYRRW